MGAAGIGKAFHFDMALGMRFLASAGDSWRRCHRRAGKYGGGIIGKQDLAAQFIIHLAGAVGHQPAAIVMVDHDPGAQPARIRKAAQSNGMREHRQGSSESPDRIGTVRDSPVKDIWVKDQIRRETSQPALAARAVRKLPQATSIIASGAVHTLMVA